MKNPIDKEQRVRLAAAEKRLADLVELIGKCERCGLQMEEYKQAAVVLGDTIGSIHQEFIGVRQDSQGGAKSPKAVDRARG